MSIEMRKVTTAFLIGLFLIGLLIVLAFFYLALAKGNYGRTLEDPVWDANFENLVIEEAHVTYLLNEIGAYNLHSPPMSGEKPRVKVIVDDLSFVSEIDRGEIYTLREESENVDMKIVTSREEVINAFQSGDIKSYLKNSVSIGKTKIELVSSYTKLFFKGYLSLYRELTGKSLSGSVIRIFRQ